MTARLSIVILGLVWFAIYNEKSMMALEIPAINRGMTIKLWSENNTYHMYPCANADGIPSTKDKADVSQVCDTLLAVQRQIEKMGAAKLEKYQKTVFQYLTGVKPIPIIFETNKAFLILSGDTSSYYDGRLGKARRNFYFPGFYGEPVIVLYRDKTFSEKQETYHLEQYENLWITEQKWNNAYGLIKETKRIQCPNIHELRSQGCTVVFPSNASFAENTLLHELLHIAKRIGFAPHSDVYRIADTYFPQRFENSYSIQPNTISSAKN